MKAKSARTGRLKKEKPLGAGHGSFERLDSRILFQDLRLKKARSFLDIACGRGAYTLAAFEYVGPEGALYAVDLWDEGIAALTEEAHARGIKNIVAKVADVERKIPLADRSVDSALMAVVLHDLVEEGKEVKALLETARVLKPGGRFAVVEFKKIDAESGPPKRVRLEPCEVVGLVTPFGFKKVKYRDLGPDLYYLIFRPGSPAGGG
jgi:ubiquinone/menaquinone biosynthesis C-methylase UbiE